jgi:hypothetical protein
MKMAALLQAGHPAGTGAFPVRPLNSNGDSGQRIQLGIRGPYVRPGLALGEPMHTNWSR